MKIKVILGLFLISALCINTSFAHTPMRDFPNLADFKERIQDWELFETYYQGQKLDVVDMHLHPGSFDTLGPKGRAFVLSTLPDAIPEFIKIPLLRLVSSFQLNPYGAFIGIKNECRRAGVANCILFATYAPETWGVEPNSNLLGYLDDRRNQYRDKPYFYGLASVNVEDWPNKKEEALDELREALEHPLTVAIKLAFAHTLTPFDDSTYYDVYEVAKEYNVPVYHHVGTSPLRKPSEFAVDELDYLLRTFDPSYLEDAIKRYPEVKFILGHAGNDSNKEGFSKFDEVFRLAETYDNVYIEISAFGSERNDPDGLKMDGVLRRALASGIVDRIIYGSDGPGFPGNIKAYKELTLRSLERVNYTFEEAEAVMAGNARRLMNIPK